MMDEIFVTRKKDLFAMNNKWIRAAIPALLLHCSIGTVYCWSTFSSEIAEYIGASKSSVGWAFSIAIFFLGMSAAFAGNLVEKNIHKSSLIASICFAVGMAGTGFFIAQKSLIGIFLCYGGIMGIGLGLGYLSPVKTLMLWFKDKKGLATGLAVAGFGAAKAIATPVMQFLLGKVGVSAMFYVLAVIYFVMMFVGHLLLKKPEGWVEQHEKTTVADFIGRFKIFGNPLFLGIWIVFYINITCGLALISQEKSILLDIGFSAATASVLGSLTAVFNAGGRLGFSAAGDLLKDRNTIYKIILALSIVFTGLTIVTGGIQNKLVVLVVALLFFVNAGYGGGFSNLPTLLSDRFGMKAISSIHGIALSAWAFAGLTGNQIAGLIVRNSADEITGYQNVLIFTGILYVVALVVDFLLVRAPEAEKAAK